MRKETRTIILDGKNHKADLIIYEESDRATIQDLYNKWKTLSSEVRAFSSRGVNFPEGISESAFCLECNSAKVIKVYGSSGSFDTIDLSNNSRQQVKATSVQDDLSSFGPNSVWDDCYFVDFYKDGIFDGSFDIYKIPDDDLIYKCKVNKKQTFTDVQKEGKRPRFSIRNKIIIPEGLRPVKTCNLFGAISE